MTVNCWYDIQGTLQGNPSLYRLWANDTVEATEERNERLTADLKKKKQKQKMDTMKQQQKTKQKCQQKIMHETEYDWIL